ncbi:MAG: sugar phosphate nucleotidyltransferase [Lachnospiraceae bacterium]|jgi:dTDP-glucose pyrophosphorylase|nr:sugar phosphate nucleotidyltransferase [Lachnospiraceae bacterium]MEE3460926.1 sugar phosphate nucleotidyltransferase [Lachnospiraceae bacterium]
MIDEAALKSYTVREDDYLFEAVRKLSRNEHKGIIALDNDNKVCGTFTRADMVRCSHLMGMQDVKLGDFINREFFALYEEQKPDQVYHSIIPVTDKEGCLTDIYFPPKKEMVKYDFPVAVMAGGRGTRLYPYTKVLPKPLVPLVGEKPMIETIMDRFHDYGPDNFYMIVNYKKEMIIDYFRDADLDYQVHFAEEKIPLGTGGGLYMLRDKIKDTFCLTNCDIILQENLSEIYEFHKESGNLITMITSLMSIDVPYGVIKVDDRQQIVDMIEKPTYLVLVNIGIYFIEPEVFDLIEDNVYIDFPSVIDKVKKAGRPVGIYPITDDMWMDMGQVSSYEHAKEVLQMKLKKE